MNKQSALQLVQPVKAPKTKRPTKAEIIAKLEDEKRELQDRNVQLQSDSNHRVQELLTRCDKLENPEQSEVIETVKTAFKRSNRLAALWGFVKGGWAPAASFILVHHEIAAALAKDASFTQPKVLVLSALVVGALLFSAPNVYQWCKAAFNSAAKAVGFVVLLEGVLVFSGTEYLVWSALGLLIAINGIQSACNLAIRRQKNEFQF